MSDLTVRMYQPGDEAGIIDLYNSVFPNRIDRSHWEWKFRDNPAGFPLIGVAVQDSKIIGHISLNAVQAFVKGQRIRAAQAVDVMVNTKCRGGRVITQVADLCTEQLESGYATFSFGFPLPRFQIFTRRILGWIEVGKVPQLVKLVNAAFVARSSLRGRSRLQRCVRGLGQAVALGWRRRKIEDNQKPPVTRLTDFDSRLDRLWEDTASGFQIAVVRDRRYLSWRYAHPDYVIYAVAEPDRMHGFVVLRTLIDEGWRIGCIADVLARDVDTARRLLRTAVAHFYREKVDLVRCWMLGHSPYYTILRRLGFIPRPNPYKLVVRTHSPSVPLSFLLEPTHWYVTLGDTDGI